MYMRPEVLPFLGVAALLGVGVGSLCHLCRIRRKSARITGLVVAVILGGYFLYFFRDPPRHTPADPTAVIAAAEGVVAKITPLSHPEFVRAASFSGLDETDLKRFLQSEEIIRISIFLSLFDVHVNRAPISGNAEFLGYFPGKHVFTFREKSSDVNQHNSILFRNEHTLCLLNQIVGPVARRVVYWPDHERPVAVNAGDRIGMMKFGSRLDMYFPASDIAVTTSEGVKVRAGETIVARLTP